MTWVSIMHGMSWLFSSSFDYNIEKFHCQMTICIVIHDSQPKYNRSIITEIEVNNTIRLAFLFHQIDAGKLADDSRRNSVIQGDFIMVLFHFFSNNSYEMEEKTHRIESCEWMFWLNWINQRQFSGIQFLVKTHLNI